MRNLAVESHVCLHGWVTLPSGEVEYADLELEDVDGYSVYFRFPTPQDPQQPFDITDEQDFTSLEEARFYAQGLAARRGVSHIEEY